MFYGRARALAAVKEALGAGRRKLRLPADFRHERVGQIVARPRGLVHALTATPGWIEGVDVWRWCLVRPGDATGDPLDALAQALFGDTALPELRAGGIDAARIARTLRDNPDDMDLILGPPRRVVDSDRTQRAADRPSRPGSWSWSTKWRSSSRVTGSTSRPGRVTWPRWRRWRGAGCLGGRHHAQRVLRAVRRAPRAGGAQSRPGPARPAAPDLCRDRPDDPLPGARRRPALGEGPRHPGQPSTTCSRKRPGATPKRSRSCNSCSTNCFAAATAGR